MMNEITAEEAVKIIKSLEFYDRPFDNTCEQSKTKMALLMAIEALEQQSNHQCNNCIHLEEQDGSNCYECIKGMADNFEAQLCEEDCVSRTNVKEQMLKYGFHAPDMTVTKFVEDCLPPVYPERPKGEWIKVDDEEPIAYDCSECGSMVSKKYNYCPNCGADMRGKEK